MSDERGDGFGRYWNYRVFSEQWTCPDDWNRGQRYLTVHQVGFGGPGPFLGTYEHPLPDDFDFIEHEPASPSGIGMEELILDAERIQKAFDLPVLIKAEFQHHFDWSEKQHAINEARHRRRKREARQRKATT